MIQGEIVENLGESQYRLQLSYDHRYTEVLLAGLLLAHSEVKADRDYAITVIDSIGMDLQSKREELDAQIIVKATEIQKQKLTAEIAKLKVELQSVQNKLNSYLVSMTALSSKHDFIEANQGVDFFITAYTNTWSDALTGIVSVFLVGGSVSHAVIIVDGVVSEVLSKVTNIKKEANFSNLALLSGWIKWGQPFAVGTIQSVGETSVANMTTINSKYSTVKEILPRGKVSVDKAAGYPYEVGDYALLEIDGDNVFSYKGWYEKPKQTLVYLLRYLHASYREYNRNDGGEYSHVYSLKYIGNKGLIINRELIAEYMPSYVDPIGDLVINEPNIVYEIGAINEVINENITNKIGNLNVRSYLNNPHNQEIVIEYLNGEELLTKTFPVPPHLCEPKSSRGEVLVYSESDFEEYTYLPRSYVVFAKYSRSLPNAIYYYGDDFDYAQVSTFITEDWREGSISEVLTYLGGGRYAIMVAFNFGTSSWLGERGADDITVSQWGGGSESTAYYYIIVDSDLNLIQWVMPEGAHFINPKKATLIKQSGFDTYIGSL